MKTYWLSTHVGYACRHSGACCTSRWPIPIERDRTAGVQGAIDAGRLSPAVTPWFQPDPTAPGEVAGILSQQPGGACVFRGPSGCAIHGTRPRSCEHFPYVCVIDARGIHVTLSHYCPTAAEMLFHPGVPEVVDGPPIFADGRMPEGLDARESLPPTRMAAGDADADSGAADCADTGAADCADYADTGAADCADHSRNGSRQPHALAASHAPRLMDWDEVTRWEQAAVRAVAAVTRVPAPPDLALFEHARAAVPPPLTWPAAPERLDAVWAEGVAPSWPEWSTVIGRYLASKVHASWAMFLASGPADVVRGVDIARAVLQVEATRQCTHAARALDKALLREALRQSDLLLIHHADPFILARP